MGGKKECGATVYPRRGQRMLAEESGIKELYFLQMNDSVRCCPCVVTGVGVKSCKC